MILHQYCQLIMHFKNEKVCKEFMISRYNTRVVMYMYIHTGLVYV